MYISQIDLMLSLMSHLHPDFETLAFALPQNLELRKIEAFSPVTAFKNLMVFF